MRNYNIFNYLPCRMVSGNEIKLCLKYFCLPIYFVHFEISLTFISPKPSPKPSDVQLLSTRHVTVLPLTKVDTHFHLYTHFSRE
jgi:hypothetical protein